MGTSIATRTSPSDDVWASLKHGSMPAAQGSAAEFRALNSPGISVSAAAQQEPSVAMASARRPDSSNKKGWSSRELKYKS